MIKLYSKPNCPQCNATKRALKNKGILFEEIDLTKDQKTLDKLVEMGYKTAPIVESASGVWAGYQPDRIEAL